MLLRWCERRYEVRLRNGSLGKAGVYEKALSFQPAVTALFLAFSPQLDSSQRLYFRE